MRKTFAIFFLLSVLVPWSPGPARGAGGADASGETVGSPEAVQGNPVTTPVDSPSGLAMFLDGWNRSPTTAGE